MPAAPLGHVLRHVRKLAGGPCAPEPTDAELLERFVAFREESAFAALVERHGRLVWGVCKRVLAHEQDAEDAFQATFLALARHAPSIARRESVAGWLGTVARRVATKARTVMARRRARERQVEDPPPERPSE